MKIVIDRKESNTYIYQQIYEKIKRLITDKHFTRNEQLPSKRGLATELNVSVNSVTTAYEQLLAEGYIYTIERSGYFVENITELQKIPAVNEVLPKDLREGEKEQSDWLSLSHIAIDASMFPFQSWSLCEQQALANYKDELGTLSHFQGPLDVRRAISQLIGQTRGVICEPEQIVIGAGTQSLMERLLSLQPENTGIAMENPGYQRFYRLFKDLSYSIMPIQLDKQGIDMNELMRTDAKIAFVTPSHQFPTGIIMPISRRNELLNWATQDKQRFIVEDDYDSEYKYETDHIPSLQSLDQNQQVVYTGTFSKTLLPSKRISYMVLPYELLRLYRKKYSDRLQEVNTLSLYTLKYFIEEGHYQKHIRRMNLHYEQKRSRLIKLLKEKFKDQVTIKDIPAGLHFLAYFKTNKTYEQLKLQAKKEKLELYMLDRFMLSPFHEQNKEVGIIIGFANIKEEDINEAIDRLSCVMA